MIGGWVQCIECGKYGPADEMLEVGFDDHGGVAVPEYICEPCARDSMVDPHELEDEQ